MCFANNPQQTASGPTPNQGAIAAQQAYNDTRKRRAEAYDSEDTDIVGKLIARAGNDNKGPSVQLKKLMGA